MQAIFLSPHYDDIAFSVNSFVEKDDIIIDVYTETKYIENKNIFLNMSVSELRKQEEKLYTKGKNVSFINLDFLDECPNITPFLFYHNLKPREIIENKILELLRILFKKGYSKLFCPLGVGKHYHHMEVFEIVHKNYIYLSQRFEIFFYVDFPYISYKNNLRQRLRYLSRFLKQNSIHQKKLLLTREQIQNKLVSLSTYKSQFIDTNRQTILLKMRDLKGNFSEIIFSSHFE